MKVLRVGDTVVHICSRKSKVSVCFLSFEPPVIKRYRIAPILQTSLAAEAPPSYLYNSGARNNLSTPEIYRALFGCCSFMSAIGAISLIFKLMSECGLNP